MNELRRTILAALHFAQSSSSAPESREPEEWHLKDQDRMRFFFAHLAGGVGKCDPELAGELLAFLDAGPGDKINFNQDRI